MISFSMDGNCLRLHRLMQAALLMCVMGAGPALAADPIELPLWTEGAPGQATQVSDETRKLIERYGGATPTRLTDITEPTITVYRPENPNGTAVIVAPGGGYMFLSWKHEGTQVCEWLNSLGVTGVLLKYRTPTRDESQPHELPVQDVQRALGLVRQRAAEWKINPDRVGLLGFSAGANLVGHASWENSQRTYPQVPGLDDPRGPDFLVFIYGGGFLNREQPTRLRDNVTVPADAPPAFFLVAHDDKNNPVEAALLYLEYHRLKRPADLHIFSEGGHGFGMRQDKHPINNWPELCAEWMRSRKLLDARAATQP